MSEWVREWVKEWVNEWVNEWGNELAIEWVNWLENMHEHAKILQSKNRANSSPNFSYKIYEQTKKVMQKVQN